MSVVFRLLAVEWMKVRFYRTFWILMALFAAAMPVLCIAFGRSMAGWHRAHPRPRTPSRHIG